MAQHDRKIWQMCREVQRHLSLALGDMDDEVLQNVHVESVVPEEGTGRLRVEVSLGAGVEEVSPIEVLQRLGALKGRLRTEVASAIRRRRAPDLTFQMAVFEEEEAPPPPRRPQPSPPAED